MILIVVEYANGKVSKSTWEMITAARELGREAPLTAFVLGSNIAAIADEVARAVDQVLVADLPALAQYDPELWSAAVAQIATEGEANLLLIGGSRSGREYSPRVAIKLDAPLLEDVITLKAAGETITAQRYTFLARVTETVESSAPIAVVTIKPGVFNPATPKTDAAEQFDVDLNLPTPRLKVTGKTAERSSRISLTEAEIVVSGGRGVGSAEGFTQYVEALADQLGAAVGATRAIVDAGWRPYSEQVGQTGKTVQPKTYIAIGISGAVQHLSGMNKSKTIVAINRDAEAPIFKIADYGIIGDVTQLVPAILTELKK
ncbi:electron transfer flavoprotein subunit alpha/FixB family protein [Tunturiibacter gelidoferens]|jgi:electron transfer flavoprotein alpha subunit|uniref:Electron transfer flavoprotein alpha subunit n=1 Tax=Tunturiibacter gelidiferens TaxID=3069689 RepID=A0A9X0QAB7_9BACT|nr:electron transfer flavoprotein subunit alpha/FixB family protein [Edaphobacter lichenicola]MBB5326608.1 electron transfer flavoprotein alpha subunit [Edaphobacter lichenicola]